MVNNLTINVDKEELYKIMSVNLTDDAKLIMNDKVYMFRSFYYEDKYRYKQKKSTVLKRFGEYSYGGHFTNFTLMDVTDDNKWREVYIFNNYDSNDGDSIKEINDLIYYLKRGKKIEEFLTL